MLALGIDIGTTGVKAAVFNQDGTMTGYAFQEYDILCPESGLAEQDAEKIWSISKAAIAQAIIGLGHNIKALSLSVQGDAVIPVDKDGNALSHAHLGMDYRGAKESADIGCLLGDKNIFCKTGMRPHPMNTLVKICWIKEHNPLLFDCTYKFTTYADFILKKLGSDEFTIDYTMASRTMAFDLHSSSWSDDILNTLGIPKEKLSRPVPSGTVVGTISKELADELKLARSVLLVAGGHDQTCAALGAGIVRENLALDSHGTAEVISTAFTSPHLDDTMFSSYYPCYIHAVPEMYFTFSLNHTGGVLLKWFTEQFCLEDRIKARDSSEQIYSYLFRQFSPEPSPLLVLPYFNGSGTPTCDLSMKGAFLGLTMSTTRHDIAKAIVESLSYELKLNLETMKQTGISIDTLRCVGGGARSPVGLQNKADILGIPVSTLKVREAACLGAAILAGTAIGFYNNVLESEHIVRLEQTYFPDDIMHRKYMEIYTNYAALYDIMKLALHKI